MLAARLATRPDGGRGRFTFFLRMDCEHTEAQRWAGGADVEVRGTAAALSLLEEAAVPATLAVVGATALAYPELAQAGVAAGHAIAGHSHRHARPYAGQPPAWQRADMRAMVAAIARACGVRVRVLAPPCHGVVDAHTLRAAEDARLRCVLSMPAAPGPPGAPPAPGALSAGAAAVAPALPVLARAGASVFAPAGGGPASVLVPPPGMRWIWDWTPLQPGWPPFSVERARTEWMEAVDAAGRDGGHLGLILHPWILESNGVGKEGPVIAETLRYAARQGASFCTFDQVVAEAVAPVGGAATPA